RDGALDAVAALRVLGVARENGDLDLQLPPQLRDDGLENGFVSKVEAAVGAADADLERRHDRRPTQKSGPALRLRRAGLRAPRRLGRAGDRRVDGARIGRLDEMVVEARGGGLRPVL